MCKAQSGHWLLLLAVGVFTEPQRLSEIFVKNFVSSANTRLRTWKGDNPKSEGLIQCYLKWPLGWAARGQNKQRALVVARV